MILRKLFHVTIVVLIYTGAILYLLHRLDQAFPKAKKKLLKWVAWLMSAFFIVVQYLRIWDFGQSFLPFQCATYLWMTIVFYFFALILAGDMILLLLYCIRPLWNRWQPCMPTVRKYYCFCALACSVLLLGYGLVHFAHPRIVRLDVEVDKPAPDWKIVFVSDLHLGTMSPKLLQQHVETINALHPDIVLLAGDQFVINAQEAEQMGYADILRQLKAPKGVYAVNGNHETYHGYQKPNNHSQDFYESMNICLLQDTIVLVDHQLALVGRRDSTILNRKSLDELTENMPQDIPGILLDHQPADLLAAQRCGIDLQLSGHMHNGQFFPMNIVQWAECLVTGKLHHGYRQIGNTQYYVTAGLGGSGVPVRIGTTGEIVVVRMK